MTTVAVPQPRAEQTSSMRERFLDVRNTSLRITEQCSPEDQMLQSMPDASPTKWHLAHTTWFFETFILLPNLPDYKPFDTRYQYLFNSYYKGLGSHPNRGSRGLMSRPSLQQVHAFRDYVERALLNFLENASAEVLDLVELGLNHEQQHQELIVTDIKHALWSSPLRPDAPIASNGTVIDTPPLVWDAFPEGIYFIGHEGDEFAFDNERPRHQVFLQDFRIASRPVTNAEYLQFIQDNGYKRPELWLSDGWDTVCAQHWDAPLYWERRDDGSCWHFTLTGLKPLDPREPVCHVSFYEADAYARWSGARLPREEEWEVAAVRMPMRGTFLEDYAFHPQPPSGHGNQQMLGDIWEWTASPYVAYPGFQPAPGLIGEYNGKFMCNQMVLRGGSCATPSSHIRASYRNFFPPQAKWQFSGIRLAQ
ncbi:MAG: ergothioneine biosynthesis protein EgtB [Acidobacteriaceae bacterium]|nr:ergothioneine biosynthesis protein EgtB [Acidobacteriaceae bacterium]